MKDFQGMLRMAYKNAWTLSTETRTQVGAVIVSPSGHRAEGVNGVRACLAPHDKTDTLVHAEESAIYWAARNGVATRNATMFAPWACCTRCARAIIESGIVLLVVHKQAMDRTPARWEGEVARGRYLLDAAGVEVAVFDGKVDGCVSVMDGKEWRP